MKELSGEELVRRLAGGNEKALSELYDRYSRPVYATGIRLLGDVSIAEDLVQDAFARVWRSAKTFDSSREISQRMSEHRISELLGPYALGDLSVEEKGELERHLEACPECRGELERVRKPTNSSKRRPPASRHRSSRPARWRRRRGPDLVPPRKQVEALGPGGRRAAGRRGFGRRALSGDRRWLLDRRATDRHNPGFGS